MRRLLVCLCVLFSVVPVLSETFEALRYLPLPTRGNIVSQADFNGDGLPDFFAYIPPGFSSTTLQAYVLLAHADGSYSDPITVTLTGAPQVCRTYDVNADHYSDIICISYGLASPGQQTLSTFLGNGDGTFQAKISTVISSNLTIQYAPATTGDLNGDGKLDLVLLDSYSANIIALFGDGTGHFSPGVPQMVSAYQRLLVQDVNGDGKADLLLGDSLRVLIGSGDGTFKLGFYNAYYQDCIFADFDKDEHLDAQCVDTSDIDSLKQVLLHGNTDGTFGEPTGIPDLSNALLSFAARDLNGDGVLDIVASSKAGMTVSLGKPGLAFESSVTYSLRAFGPPYIGSDPMFSDYNGDGILDVAIPGYDGIYFIDGRGDGSLRATQPVESGTAIGDIAIGDFDEDGIPDVVTSGSPSLQLNRGKGDGTFVTSTPIQISDLPGSANLSSSLLEGDFNGDGHLDLITDNNQSLTQVFFGKGDGTFGDPVIASSTYNYIPLIGATVVDINGDGRADLIAPYNTYPTGAVWVMLSNGDGSFSAQSIPGFDITKNTVSVAVSDVNGDNKPDLVVSDGKGTQIFLGKGDGTLEPVASAPASPSLNNASFYPGRAVFGDFDKDGKRDFAISSTPDLNFYSIVIYYGNGDGTFSAPLILPTSVSTANRSFNLAAQDLNGDGLDDLVYTSSSTFDAPEITILHAKAGRSFDGGTGLMAGSGSLTPMIADFNRDGRPDLLFSNSTTAFFTVLLNRESTRTTLTVDKTATQYGQSVSFTAQVISASGNSAKPPTSATVTLSGLPNSPVVVPVTFSSGGQWNGTATYQTAVLPPGTYTVTAGLAAACCIASSSSAPVNFVVNPAATTTTIALTPVPPLTGQPTTLQVQVSSQATVNSGTITFFDQGTQIGTAAVTSGAGSLTTSPLSGGGHSFTAAYSGDQNFLTSTSQPLAVTVFDSGYQIAAAQPNLSLGADGATDIVTISPVKGFSGNVKLSCSVAPADGTEATNLPTCSFSSSVLTLAGSPIDSTLILSSNKNRSATQTAGIFDGKELSLSLLAFASVLFRRGKKLSWSVFSTLLIVHAALLSGCAGQPTSRSDTGVTAKKLYNVTVAATSDMPGATPAPLTIKVEGE